MNIELMQDMKTIFNELLEVYNIGFRDFNTLKKSGRLKEAQEKSSELTSLKKEIYLMKREFATYKNMFNALQSSKINDPSNYVEAFLNYKKYESTLVSKYRIREERKNTLNSSVYRILAGIGAVSLLGALAVTGIKGISSSINSRKELRIEEVYKEDEEYYESTKPAYSAPDVSESTTREDDSSEQSNISADNSEVEASREENQELENFFNSNGEQTPSEPKVEESTPPTEEKQTVFEGIAEFFNPTADEPVEEAPLDTEEAISTALGNDEMLASSPMDVVVDSPSFNAGIESMEQIQTMYYAGSIPYDETTLIYVTQGNESESRGTPYPLEQYVEGVLNGEGVVGAYLNLYNNGNVTFDEMMEGLKSFAILARSYGLYQTVYSGKHAGDHKINRTSGKQCFTSQYFDSSNERACLARAAVYQTKGIVLSYDGKPCNTTYDSFTPGGREDSECYISDYHLVDERGREIGTHTIRVPKGWINMNSSTRKGHKRGASQYGLLAMAHEGYTAEEIVKLNYMEGTTFGVFDPSTEIIYPLDESISLG